VMLKDCLMQKVLSLLSNKWVNWHSHEEVANHENAMASAKVACTLERYRIVNFSMCYLSLIFGKTWKTYRLKDGTIGVLNIDIISTQHNHIHNDLLSRASCHCVIIAFSGSWSWTKKLHMSLPKKIWNMMLETSLLPLLWSCKLTLLHCTCCS
jgi:hypothetical protein